MESIASAPVREGSLSKRLATLLLDESAEDREQLVRLIARHPVLNLSFAADSVSAAVGWMQSATPDVIICEARYADGSLRDHVTNFPPSCKIVIISTDRDFGWQAYELDAIDFLPKPVAAERFAITVRRLMRIDWRPTFEQPQGLDQVMIPFERGRRSARLADICRIAACGAYSLVTLANGESEIVLRSLVRWQQVLPYGSFVQVHRSALVNRQRIRSFKLDPNSKTYVLEIADLPQPIPVSRRQAVFLKKLLFGDSK